MKIKKKFLYKGIELRIVEREENYMNSKETVLVTRVLAPNGGTIPIQLKHKQTLKSIQADVTALLDGFENRGANVIEELTKSAETK